MEEEGGTVGDGMWIAAESGFLFRISSSSSDFLNQDFFSAAEQSAKA